MPSPAGTRARAPPAGFNIIADIGVPAYSVAVDVMTAAGATVTMTARDSAGGVIATCTSGPAPATFWIGTLTLETGVPIASLEWWPSVQTAVVGIDNLRLSGDPFHTVFDVYFDTVSPPVAQIASGLLALTCPPSPGPLAEGATYYWQVVARNDCGQTPGPVWSFTTEEGPPPVRLNVAPEVTGVCGAGSEFAIAIRLGDVPQFKGIEFTLDDVYGLKCSDAGWQPNGPIGDFDDDCDVDFWDFMDFIDVYNT